MTNVKGQNVDETQFNFSDLTRVEFFFSFVKFTMLSSRAGAAEKVVRCKRIVIGFSFRDISCSKTNDFPLSMTSAVLISFLGLDLRVLTPRRNGAISRDKKAPAPGNVEN